MKPWVNWCVNHNLKFVLFAIWVVCFPYYFIANIDLGDYLKNSTADAMSELESIKTAKKGQV
jgi:hypothetical protein